LKLPYAHTHTNLRAYTGPRTKLFIFYLPKFVGFVKRVTAPIKTTSANVPVIARQINIKVAKFRHIEIVTISEAG
jgi:hypothetical protein